MTEREKERDRERKREREKERDSEPASPPASHACIQPGRERERERERETEGGQREGKGRYEPGGSPPDRPVKAWLAGTAAKPRASYAKKPGSGRHTKTSAEPSDKYPPSLAINTRRASKHEVRVDAL